MFPTSLWPFRRGMRHPEIGKSTSPTFMDLNLAWKITRPDLRRITPRVRARSGRQAPISCAEQPQEQAKIGRILSPSIFTLELACLLVFHTTSPSFYAYSSMRDSKHGFSEYISVMVQTTRLRWQCRELDVHEVCGYRTHHYSPWLQLERVRTDA